MATLTLNIDPVAAKAAKAAYDAEFKSCIAAGMKKTEAQDSASKAGAAAYAAADKEDV